jgi:glycine dehydrogenase subunit 1
MRYLPHTRKDIDEMLAVVGVKKLEDLFPTIPYECHMQGDMNLPPPMNEWELNRHMDTLSDKVAVPPKSLVFLGAGSYCHHIPATVSYLLSRSEFVTSYTPYQPEISQGTLQAIYEYQTLASRLMGTEVATASHYDGATALAEALLMAIRITRRQRVAVSRLVHPYYREVVKTYFDATGFEVIEISAGDNGQTDLSSLGNAEDLAAVAIQSPNFFGCLEPLKQAAEMVHSKGSLMIGGFTEALAYGLLKSPGSQGADIVAGEGQSLGLPQNFGGPGLGMLGSIRKYMRNLPGRLVGRTTDLEGRDGFVLTLATREQHIRREKATSNICSNNSLCAVTAAAYMVSLGRTGIRQLAGLNHDKAEYLKKGLENNGAVIPFTSPTFNEFVARFPEGFEERYLELQEKGIIAGLPLKRWYPEMDNCWLLCATETSSKEDMDVLIREVTS